MATLWHDLRYGARMLSKSPGFTITALLSLSLGIGANTAIFTLLSALLFRPLPVDSPEELVALNHVHIQSGSLSSFSYPGYVEFRDENDVFSDLLAYADIGLTLHSESAVAERLEAQIVSGNYFAALGVGALHGRTFLPEEDRTPGTHPVVLISHGLWQRRFGGKPETVGSEIQLNGRSFTVVGIAPRGFRGIDLSSVPDVWVPMMMHGEAMPLFRIGEKALFDSPGTHWISLAGRLSPDLTPSQVEAALKNIARRQEVSRAETHRGWTVALTPLSEQKHRVGESSPALRITTLLTGVVGLVLLIACANVANLSLVRGIARQREMGIRVALGAGRGRLLRQLLTESLLLSVSGGAAGLLIAYWGKDAIRLFDLPGIDPRRLNLDFNAQIVGFALLLSIFTGIFFGLVPALRASKLDLTAGLKERATARPTSGGARVRHLLAASQIALCLVLLVTAGLFIRTLYNWKSLDLGFETQHVTLFRLSPSLAGYSETRGMELYRQLAGRAEAMPGVNAASWAAATPLSSSRYAMDVVAEASQARPQQETFNVDFNVVSPGYFETVGIPLLQGRDFTSQDRTGTTPVAIVNASMARQLWPGESVLGKRLRLQAGGPPVEVVGVVEDGRYQRSWRNSPPRFMFLPVSQLYQGGMALLVRSEVDSGQIIDAVRREASRLDKDLPLLDVTTMRDQFDSALSQERMGAFMLGAFGLLALVLAVIGLYGVIAHSVSERTREIGIRMALGANQHDVLSMVVGKGLTVIGLGITVGAVASVGLTRLIAGFLYGVSSTDPATFVFVSVVLVAISMTACYVPARRASTVDPLVALRFE